ncbi:MAG: hypothetical protein AAGG54_07995 [Pseudomonadota bacterium]
MTGNPSDPIKEANGAALRARIERLAEARETIVDGWRRRRIADQTDMLTIFASEIDETVFLRRLRFRNASGAILVVEAANRRLRQVVAPLPDVLDDFEALVEGPFQGNDSEALDVLLTMVTVFASDSEEILLRAERFEASDASASYGISGAALARAWAVPLLPAKAAPAAPKDPIAALRTALAQQVEASLYRPDHAAPIEASDPDSDLARKADAIVAWSAALARQAKLASGDAPGGFYAITGPSADRFRICAQIEGQLWVAEISGMAVDAAAQVCLPLWAPPG